MTVLAKTLRPACTFWRKISDDSFGDKVAKTRFVSSTCMIAGSISIVNGMVTAKVTAAPLCLIGVYYQ